MIYLILHCDITLWDVRVINPGSQATAWVEISFTRFRAISKNII